VTTSYSVTCTGDSGSATAMTTVSVASTTVVSNGGGGGSTHGHKKK
jgi:hypothetical protein